MNNVGGDIVNNALTLEEATRICAGSQHMHGKTAITEKGEGEVIRVVVAPADDINKWIFLQRFIESNNPVEALEFYKVPYYDVLLLVQIAGENVFPVSLRTTEIPVSV